MMENWNRPTKNENFVRSKPLFATVKVISNPSAGVKRFSVKVILMHIAVIIDGVLKLRLKNWSFSIMAAEKLYTNVKNFMTVASL
jgi:hypothetical protein